MPQLDTEAKQTPGQAGRRGVLILIGGSEDKKQTRSILREVARHAGGGKLVIATLASSVPDEQWQIYSETFRQLGTAEVEHLRVENREDAVQANRLDVLRGASGIFFTGGDQLKITTKLGGTPLYDAIRAYYRAQGGLVAGTSAGASAMGETMLVSSSDAPHKIGAAFAMAKGLGLVKNLIIDQHFAQRARIERLVGAVAENPSVLGIGIDEDTAIVICPEEFRVIGTGAVYVADGHGITFTNFSEQEQERDRPLSVYDIRLHVLIDGARFDLKDRRPLANGATER